LFFITNIRENPHHTMDDKMGENMGDKTGDKTGDKSREKTDLVHIHKKERLARHPDLTVDRVHRDPD